MTIEAPLTDLKRTDFGMIQPQYNQQLTFADCTTMPSLGALGNLDIWTEVLQYFYISLHLDSESEIKDKRRALLRIALLSPSLTTPALDILWRDMSSLEPITRVIDSKATSPDDQFLIYQDDGHGGYWVNLQI